MTWRVAPKTPFTDMFLANVVENLRREPLLKEFESKFDKLFPNGDEQPSRRVLAPQSPSGSLERQEHVTACPYCAGTGSVLSMPSVPGGSQYEEPCEDCNGTGER